MSRLKSELPFPLPKTIPQPRLAIPIFFRYIPIMQEKKTSANPFEDDPLFLEVMAEALAIQDRFSAEPIYAKTGKGYLKSVGVSEIQEVKLQNQRTDKKET